MSGISGGSSGGGLTSPVGISDGGTGQTSAAAAANALHAVGDIVIQPSAPASGTWLECNGQRVSQSTYASLYALLGKVGTLQAVTVAAGGSNKKKTGSAYGASKFVSVGDFYVSVSTDNGATWSEQDISPLSLLQAVAYDGSGLWVAVDDSGGIYTASDPASTWTSRTSGVVTALNAVTYAGGVLDYRWCWRRHPHFHQRDNLDLSHLGHLCRPVRDSQHRFALGGRGRQWDYPDRE